MDFEELKKKLKHSTWIFSKKWTLISKQAL